MFFLVYSSAGLLDRAWSGRPDSNRRPRVPKTRALTKLRHAPRKPECRSLCGEIGARASLAPGVARQCGDPDAATHHLVGVRLLAGRRPCAFARRPRGPTGGRLRGDDVRHTLLHLDQLLLGLL